MDKKMVPEVRFKGFTDDWEQHKLGEFYDFKNGLNKEKAFFGSGVPIVNFVDVFHNRILMPDMLMGRVTLTEKEIKNHEVKQGDIFFTRTSETINEIGYPSVMLGVPDCTVFSGFVLRGRAIGDDPLNNLFKSYIFFTEHFRKEMIKKSSMTTRALTSGTALKEMNIKFPALENEQISIGTLFKHLDVIIALQQQQLDLYTKLKKGLLQKLFPKDGEKVPEIRFTDFHDDWKQQYLSNLTTMHARIGWQNLRTSEFLNEGKYVLITGTDFKDGNIDYSNIHFVSKERFDQDKKIQVQNGSILITKDGTLGKVAYVQGLSAPATLNAGVFNVIIRKNINVNSKYLFHYLSAPFLLKFASTHSTGGTIKHLNQNVLTKFPIPISSLNEQNKISDLLTLLNNSITLQQRNLDKLKLLKQFLLEKLFI
ncbi:restriction endonuclease subunit S [Companilactobacillus sp. HBUAS56257]|uniref:restriction endonuclease subunit S n=1 Tax=Companilactobacillus sp. HBUAS56257 TaxID=3109360 RepID=UPI002FF1442F